MSAPAPARRAAFEVLRRTFEHGAYTDRVFEAAARRHELDGRERSQALRLAYGAVRGRGTSDWLIAKLARRPVEKLDPPVTAALRLGIWELLNSSGTPARAAVNEAVELARRGGAKKGTGLVNAVLRRAATEAPAMLDGLDESDPKAAAIKHSYPRWVAELWWRELGAADALALMAAFNEPAERALRVSGGEGVASALLVSAATRPQATGLLAAEEAIIADGPLEGALAEAIDAGRALPQSRASQAVVAALDPQPGERVLDLCAGPGVKTTQIASRIGPDGELVSVEADVARGSQISDLVKQMSVREPRIVIADASEFEAPGLYDRVLLDPPCSALGTLASRPDVRWRRKPSDITELVPLQRRLLAKAIAALAPGGTLVYSTCTISKAENEDVVTAAAEAEGVTIDDLGAIEPGLVSPHDPRFLQTRPDRDHTDGFFIARLRR